MKHLKVTSALLAAVMCVSMVMTPVMADETQAPSETQTTEAAEQNESEETSDSDEQEPEIVDDKVLEDEDSAEAADAVLAKGKCGKKVKWTLSKKGVLKITGKGAMKNYTYKLSGKNVTSTAPWFKYASKIKKVTISKKVTTVGNFAFYLCKNLTSVKLSKKTKSIGMAAFCLCPNLKSISIPKKVTSIGMGAFSGTGLTSLVLPNSVKSIGRYAFEACASLKTVKIPVSVKTIGDEAFCDCTKLETVNVPIASLTKIGEKAFAGCTSLKSFKIPLSVVELGGFTFDGCTALENAYISAKLYAKSTGIFNGCTKLDSGKPTIYTYADPGEENTDGNVGFKVVYPEVNGNGTVAITMINPAADKVVIPDVIVYKGVSYKVVRIDRLSYIPTCMKSLSIGKNVLTIADGAFSNCPELETVTGGYKLTTIGSKAFEKCPKLKVFNITSKSLKKIGAFAFSGDTALTTLVINKTTKLTKSGVKNSLKGSSVKTVKVKKSKVKKFKKIFKKKNSGKKVSVKK